MPKRRTRQTNPEDSKIDPKTRKLVRVLCGWCATSDHKKCKPELIWYERHYVCSCSCADAFFANLDKERSEA